MKISNGVFDVKATCGDTQLGGNNFDSKIVDWLAERFIKKYKIDLRRDRQALQRLTEAAEKAKCELSGLQKSAQVFFKTKEMKNIVRKAKEKSQ